MLSTLGRSAAMGALVVSLYAVASVYHHSDRGGGLLDLRDILRAGESGPVAGANPARRLGPRERAVRVVRVDRSNRRKCGGRVLIVTVGAIPSLGIDAASYVVAALFIALIGATVAPKAQIARTEGLFQEVREGSAYLRNAKGLFQLTIASLVMNFLFSIVLTFLVVYPRRKSCTAAPSFTV